MNEQDDPFERAIEREQTLRQRAVAASNEDEMLRVARRSFLFLDLGWAAVVAGHWLLFPEPQWLAVLHTLVFVLFSGMCLAASLAQKRMSRLRRLQLEADAPG